MEDKDEYNSVVQNEPNLLNNSISYDHLKGKVNESNNENNVRKGVSDADKNIMDDIMKKLDAMKATETDMYFQYLANPDKLVGKENIQLFEKPNYPQKSYVKTGTDTDKDKSRHATETYANQEKVYTQETNTTLPENNYSYEQPKPRPSSYGPSYGDGSEHVYQDQSQDLYEGFSSEDELHIAKLNMLRQLGELTQHGVKLSQNYSMRSDYKAMKFENDLHRSIRDKHNGTKWLGNFLLNACWGIELANENFNPFEFKLKGWSDQMNDDIDEYYDVLGELYEKWFKSGKPIPPELKLMFMIGGSAVKFHIANTALGKIPTLGEALKQNPALAKKLNEQSVSSKVKENYEKKLSEQHQHAMKKAEDLQMLKQKEMEFREQQDKQQQQQLQQQQLLQQQALQQQMMQQQLLNKEMQLKELQKQLMERSDTRSIYSNDSSRKKKPVKKQEQEVQIPTPRYYQQSQPIQQTTMDLPNIPASLRGKYGAKVIQPPTKSFNYSGGSGEILTSNKDIDNLSMDPKIDDLLEKGFDSQSRVSSASSVSVVSKASSKRGRKKPIIKIDTK